LTTTPSLDSLIVAPSCSDNSLGRALSLAEVFRLVGGVRLLAADDGPLWQGARDSDFRVERFHSRADIGAAIAGTRPAVVVTVKPFRQSLRWTAQALRASVPDGRRPTLVVDLDDLDAAIHAIWHRELPPLERTRQLTRSDLSPLRILARIRQLLPAAGMLTVSSWALRGRFPPFRGPELRLPHPRSTRAYEPPVPSERLRLGFLGTPVGYKGLDTVGSIVAARTDTELHVLAGAEASFASLDPERLVVHPHRGPDTIARAFRHVDVVVLPQDAAEPAARYQLPAKLVDALRFGRPVVATDTPPIRELAGPSVRLVPSWERLDDGLAALQRFAHRDDREALGRQGAEAWAAAFSAETLAGQLAAALANAGAPGAVAARSRLSLAGGRVQWTRGWARRLRRPGRFAAQEAADEQHEVGAHGREAETHAQDVGG